VYTEPGNIRKKAFASMANQDSWFTISQNQGFGMDGSRRWCVRKMCLREQAWKHIFAATVKSRGHSTERRKS
jgi:hypothetical protein